MSNILLIYKEETHVGLRKYLNLGENFAEKSVGQIWGLQRIIPIKVAMGRVGMGEVGSAGNFDGDEGDWEWGRGILELVCGGTS